MGFEVCPANIPGSFVSQELGVCLLYGREGGEGSVGMGSIFLNLFLRGVATMVGRLFGHCFGHRKGLEGRFVEFQCRLYASSVYLTTRFITMS